MADRFPRRRVLIVTQATSMGLAFALAALTFADAITVPWILALAALGGVVNAFDIPTRQAFAIDMVGRDDLVNAIALNSSIFNGARVMGPAIAGLLVARIGEAWCFLANGVSYFAVLASLVAMRVAAPPPPCARHRSGRACARASPTSRAPGRYGLSCFSSAW